MSVDYLRRPDGLGEPLGRYSHVAIGSGSLVAIAGQVGIDAAGTLVGKNMDDQLRQTFVNLGIALHAAGAGYADILKMNTYLAGDHIEEFMAARAKVFADIFPTEVYPPNTLVVIQRLVEPELLVEVEALAIVPSQD